MKVQGIVFSEVYDLLGIRIITKTVRDCYAALGLIHTLWRPIPGRFKDYLAMPKANRYQSIHTTVIGPHGNPLEIQIRTEEMHRIAEFGIAAHWHYKEGDKAPEEYTEIILWLRQVMEWQQEMENPLDFMESLKIDLFTHEVYVFTPKGKPLTFPRGATPIDFAYAIHTQIGDTCIGAKVNGKLVPLKYQLHSGDIVEIQTAKNHTPPAEWMKIAKTSRAINKIRHFHKTRESETCLVIGKEIFSKECKRLKLNFKKIFDSPEMNNILEKTGFKKTDDLLIAAAYGKITARKILEPFLDKEVSETKQKTDISTKKKISKEIIKESTTTSMGIRIEGGDNILIRLARCCNPIPGDHIKGFVTIGKGISVHRATCVNFMKIESKADRVVDLFWDDKEQYFYPVIIAVEGTDRPGLLADITSVISKENVNIITGHMRALEDKRAIGYFTVEVPNIQKLNHLMSAVKNVKAIIDVKRDIDGDSNLFREKY
ncbi:MAG: hypothetical protein A2161_11710 [Candidatus Schekmanbacteria bacterium RBG_13_48_7]|uniref:TGS domain-containing protein n=1 Tax=Candidatus Schekmanbacteria bacterium RBG_13_48_7 TaxID=1817878 RepID=A0A1F7S0P8_9BACT|nr:MAG: hypothetical protein A2161_11710 [Candidatus Schekmanbacteria bacterium RBG_13_48_7]